MRNWFFLVLVLLTGCTYEIQPPQDEEGGGEMTSTKFKPLEWGQTRKIAPEEWERGKPFTVVERSAEYSGEDVAVGGVKNPVVKNLTLGCDFPGSLVTGTFALRWKVRFGVGGGSEEFLVDASDLQQMSLSADQIRVSVVSDYVGITNEKGEPLGLPFSYSNPAGGDIAFSAFFTEGMTATDSPTYTQRFLLNENAGAVVPIPKFAAAFRILGDPTAGDSPFTADMTYSLKAPDGVVTDLYEGDEILPVRLAPMPTGIASVLVINNAAMGVGASGSIEWELDL